MSSMPMALGRGHGRPLHLPRHVALVEVLDRGVVEARELSSRLVGHLPPELLHVPREPPRVPRILGQPVELLYKQRAAPRAVDAPPLELDVDAPFRHVQVAHTDRPLVVAAQALVPATGTRGTFFGDAGPPSARSGHRTRPSTRCWQRIPATTTARGSSRACNRANDPLKPAWTPSWRTRWSPVTVTFVQPVHSAGEFLPSDTRFLDVSLWRSAPLLDQPEGQGVMVKGVDATGATGIKVPGAVTAPIHE